MNGPYDFEDPSPEPETTPEQKARGQALWWAFAILLLLGVVLYEIARRR